MHRRADALIDARKSWLGQHCFSLVKKRILYKVKTLNKPHTWNTTHISWNCTLISRTKIMREFEVDLHNQTSARRQGNLGMWETSKAASTPRLSFKKLYTSNVTIRVLSGFAPQVKQSKASIPH